MQPATTTYAARPDLVERLDELLQSALARDARALPALSADPLRRGERAAARPRRDDVDAMRAAAAAGGLDCLIAPVRPTLKDRYPLTPIESYAGWRRDDGSAFDPWIRVHERLGGQILGIADCSMTVEGGVAEWESWTGMAFPESGAYVLPQALVPIEIDRASDRGRYVEPNVWMRHSPRGA